MEKNNSSAATSPLPDVPIYARDIEMLRAGHTIYARDIEMLRAGHTIYARDIELLRAGHI
jgi:hypothetical protein